MNHFVILRTAKKINLTIQNSEAGSFQKTVIRERGIGSDDFAGFAKIAERGNNVVQFRRAGINILRQNKQKSFFNRNWARRRLFRRRRRRRCFDRADAFRAAGHARAFPRCLQKYFETVRKAVFVRGTLSNAEILFYKLFLDASFVFFVVNFWRVANSRKTNLIMAIFAAVWTVFAARTVRQTVFLEMLNNWFWLKTILE